MDEGGHNFRHLCFCVWILIALLKSSDGASVSKIEPHYGSLGGETRLTIYGRGFSADQFSQNDDPNTGNKVYLVGESGSEFSCPVHKDGSTEVQIMCYTPERMIEENYYVKVVVDGTALSDSDLCNGNPTSNHCTYKPKADNTPTIETLTPQSGKPGSFVVNTGKLISDRYGSNMEKAKNGKLQKLLRIYVGPQDCALKDGDNFYNLTLETEDSDSGTLKCKTKGTSVGFFNASFIIESPYGRSKPNSEVYRVSYNDQIYMFQAYTDITSISPNKGSTAGGLTLTIHGNYFDNRSPYTAPKAYIGDTECVVTKVVLDQYIECTVAADPQYTATKYAGNRGVNFEYWTSTSMSNLDGILGLTSSSPGYVSSALDETHHMDVNDTMDNYVSKMTTYFSPPHTGQYEFQLKGDDTAKLFVDGVAKATSSGSWASSDRITLQSNSRYLLEVVHSETTGDSHAHLRAKFFETRFTSAWTGKAKQEKQAIKITSTVVYDVQDLAFNQFTSQTHTQEVQTVEVETAGEFRFGLFGVYTAPLTTQMDEISISDAVNALPIFGSDESLTVARNPSTPPSYTFTFVSKRGDFPAISVVKVAQSSDVRFTVTEDTKGVPDMDTMALLMEGAVSNPFTMSSLSASTLSTAVNSLFEARCPKVFESASLSKFYESYESSQGLFRGTRAKNTDPFCGKYSLKNPARLYKRGDDDLGIMLSSYKMLCFAYKGLLTNSIGLKYSHKQASDGEKVSHWTNFDHTYQRDSDTRSGTWYYTCIDIHALVLGRYPSDTQHRVEEVWVNRENVESDIYVDSTFIGRDVTITDTEINRLRLPAAMPNGAVVDTVTVTSSGTNTYTATLKPFECGNQLPLIELANGMTRSGAIASPSVAATVTLNNGGSGSLAISRSSAASPPVVGFIDVTYNGKTKQGLNVSLEAVNFKRELETLQGIGSLMVEKSGNCANYDLDVTFLTLPGDLSEMTLNSGRLTGINAAGSIQTKVDGGLFYDPLTGDMASTVHSKAQVKLYINDVPVACSGDCSFDWDAASTPAVTAVNPASGTSALGTTITITGTGFSSTPSQNTVTIGNVNCSITAATSSSITCDVGNGPVGSHKVVVTVTDKGDAAHSSGDVTFEYTASISSISPTTGSLGGGAILSLTGYGFKSGAEVTINSVACAVQSVLPDIIQCIIPASSSSGTYDVVVVQGAVTLTFSSYTYDSGLTATVNSVSPSSIGVQGATLTISGSSFSSTQGIVFVGTKQATITSWSDTSVVVETGSLDAGNKEVKVETQSGFAMTSANVLPTIDVDLSISNVFPLQGSVLGGTRLTITGSGFGTNDTLVDIKVGDVSCDVSSLTNTQIVCLIATAGRTHVVTNKGTDPTFGLYYSYDKPQLTIQRGDIVQWAWETPAFVKDITHAVIEVASPSSTEAKAGGFTSGTPSANGQYQYQFMQTGTYYVWSGYVDTYGIKNYAGTIEVVNEASSLGEVKVQVAGKMALHNVGGASNPTDSSSCKAETSAKSGCSDALPTGGDANKFNFAFWTCSTPMVNSIDQQNGTVQTVITVSGEGLSTVNCQNEVSFGGLSCNAVTSSDTSLTCTVPKAGTPELGILHATSVRVGNRGNAILNVASLEERSFGLLPNIEDIQPTSGSLAGGAVVTITGFGFGDAPLVTIGGYTCSITSSSYSQIVCEVPASTSQGEQDIVVNAYVNGSPMPAACETNVKTCRFTYASLWTPKVTSISHNVMAGSTSFNITGTMLGDVTTELDVSIGGSSATVTSADNTVIYATVTNVPAGTNDVIVKVKDYGKASGSLTVTGTGIITSVSPASGSTYGQQLITIQGNGFVDGQTTVTLDGADCNITSISLAEVVCLTPTHNAGTVSLAVTSNSVSYSPESFDYATSSTPTVSSISPQSGLAGSTLTITGSNLAGGSVTVQLDGVPCAVTSSSSSEIQCTLGNHATGSVPVSVHVTALGASNTDVQFEYQLSLSSVSPTQGGTAGGQRVTLTGTGFTTSATVTVCNEPCPFISVTSTEYVCKTPSVSAQTCDVEISVNGLSKSLSSAYTYDAGLTPTVSGVSPTRGGTGGGTTITVSGSGFGSSTSDVEVRIDGSQCVVQTVSGTQLQCVTGPHQGSVQATVEVEVGGNGIAQESPSGAAAFSYIDVWSSSFTWGGGSLPQAGEFIIIPAGMTLLLDTDTPVLGFLLIQGGQLIFDDKDVELQANIIMITDGGLLQVGTEAAPFQHKGIITLHGHHRSKELPIYGTKVLAVRNGTLDLHGIEVPVTWTRLAATAASGSTSLTLVDPVEWNVGDEIVIAATGDHHSQSENEKKKITAISGNKKTLTLDSALEAEHVGTEETFDGTLVEFRAEVGLLTHNVVFRGNTESQWETEVKACEAGFNTGEFVTQTCFQGRFGDEMGSSQFGAIILVHSPVKDTHEAQARLSYIEVTFAGQAFRLGRYPVHFHLNGDMSTSYVRGLGIHQTFNRAVNIHGTHNTMVEKTVIYNIMGGAFFLEDGIETGNTFQYNLAMFVRESSSLLNDDITPASFWLTNPNNTVQHNAAAGGSHFGYWYRMHDNPEGPSFTSDVCCKKIPLGTFYNNSAHSFGWFGLWIFPDYFPVQGGCGGTVPEPAVFQNLFAWNCEKGAEAVNSGSLQFDGFIMVQNKKAGYEGKLVIDVPLYTADSPMVKNSLIVGKTTVIPNSVQGCTDGGIIFPYGDGFMVKNTRFVNFADSGCAALRWTRIDGTCGDQCGGYTYHTEQLSFTNAPNKAIYAWEWEGMVLDVDGTLTSKSAGWSVVPNSGSLPSDCEAASEFSVGKAAYVCPAKYKFHRFAFKEALPASLEGKAFQITNQYGTGVGVFREKRISHKPGWMCAFIGGETYSISFENADALQNISFNGQFGGFDADDYIFLTMKVETVPDRFSIDGGQNFINATVGGLDPTTAKNGDWEWDNTNSQIKFIVHGRKRSKRGASMTTYSVDRPWSLSLYKCFYTDCIPPPDPETVPPATERPLQYQNWEDTGIWNVSDDGYITNTGGSYGVPQALDDVKIAFGEWVVVNGAISKLGTLLLEGVLEFDDKPSASYELNAKFIIIRGGRLIIGWPNNPFDGVANIILRGNHSSPFFNAGDGPTIGSKAIGVFGGLDLFGKDVGVAWTQLSTTATVGANQIVLKDAVTWSVGDEIVIGPTTYNAWQTESFKISAVAADNKTLTLNDTLKYKHIAHTETLSNGYVVDIAAAVGMLTRNIKVIGEDYSDLYSESFGARVLVGLVTYKGSTYGGFARLSNVEFYHTGQEGFTEEYDPRFSVAYVATGTVSDVKPSFVTKCAFHNGFNTAVGAFGAGSLNVTDNVVFGSVGNGLSTSSDDTRLINNLVTLVITTSAYQDRFEKFNPRYEAGIEALKAKNLILQDNLVTGSERVAYHVATQDCTATGDAYRNNRAFANLMGVLILPRETLPQSDCAKLSGFIAWKNYDYGIYYQNSPDLVLDNNVLIENTNGILAFVLGPAPVDHQYASRTIDVTNSTFVGATSTFDCAADILPPSDHNTILSVLARSGKTPTGGMIGLVFPNFNQADNEAPVKPWKGIMSYNSIGGLMRVSGNTFANYLSSSCKGDFAVATNIANDDLQHPIEAQRNTMANVDNSNKIVYHRPNVGKINSADCVDMDCDAFKKALLKDLDGTFLGHVGSVIPQSEYEWGGDPRRGLGDNRIPKEMVTDQDGNTIPYSTLMPNKGVIRNSNCTYHSTWQAYECQEDLNYELLVIESMDEDTETRRLSPVAVLGDGYVDLINGPQDHGWCSGYTCRLRLSTFHALVATDKEYLIHFTGLTPKSLRYRLLNVDSTKTVKISVWYPRSNRLDVFVDGTFVAAVNAQIDSQGRYTLAMPKGNEFEPQLANATGTNYFDKDTSRLTMIIKGSQVIDIHTPETIIVSFSMPAMSVADFFGDSIVENLASFLNIPLNKVRVVNVVAASASSGRKKRSSSGIVVEVEIGNEPTTSLNGTASNPLDYNSLLSLAGDIVSECQAGNVSTSFNVSGGCNSVQVPSQDGDTSAITYSTQTPQELVFSQSPEPQYEGVPLKTQPKIRATDIAGAFISSLGTPEYPWQLTASIRAGTGSPSAGLNGTLTVNASSGWFNFTDLAISHMGTGYILDFNVTYPTVASNFTIASSAFDVAGRPLKVGSPAQTSGSIVRNARFSVTLDLRDSNTDEIISDIAWRGHTWTAEASVLGNPTYGSLSGIISATFDPSSGQAMFPDLNITGFGTFYVQFRVVSSPADFNLTMNHKLSIANPAHVGMTIEQEDQIEVKFDVDFNKVLPTQDKQNEFEQMILSEYANLWPDVELKLGSIREGSIIVTFTIAGTTTNVNTTAHSLCDTITNGTSYSYNGYSLTIAPYMTINNVTYYGVTCGSVASEDDDKTLKPFIIALIVVFAVLIIIGVVILVVWRLSSKSGKLMTVSSYNSNGQQSKSGYNNAGAENILYNENSFSSLKFRNNGAMAGAPRATQMDQVAPPAYNEYFKQPLSGPIVSARTPRDVLISARGTPSRPTHISVADLESQLEPHAQTNTLTVAAQGSRPVTPSTPGSATPHLSRPLSALRDCDSPLPPVGARYSDDL